MSYVKYYDAENVCVTNGERHLKPRGVASTSLRRTLDLDHAGLECDELLGFSWRYRGSDRYSSSNLTYEGPVTEVDFTSQGYHVMRVVWRDEEGQVRRSLRRCTHRDRSQLASSLNKAGPAAVEMCEVGDLRTFNGKPLWVCSLSGVYTDIV